ncbi:MAG TPA: hypothetical protein VK207_03315 [Bacteroidales bacterium]|nr:hypothetical protein [Bacteroidales bacterium]
MKQVRTNRMFMIMLLAALCAICNNPVTGQAKYLGKDFIRYCADLPWEDIFVHTDREKYIAGETMWFRVYSFDRQTMKPSPLSRIAYVELLNYDNRPVMRRRIYLNDGSGPGDITLPDTLSPGIYTLKAYTAWMKNFLPAGAFVRKIGIYNALNINAEVRKPALYTEGETTKLTGLNEPGFSLVVNNQKADILEISLETSADFRRNNGEFLNIFIHTRGNINITESAPLTGDITKRVISKKMLMPGVNHITVFNSRGRHISEKFIYTPPAAKASFSLATQDAAGRREKIALKIMPVSDTISFMEGSVSVTPLTEDTNPRLEEFLLFGNEFGNELWHKLSGIDLLSRNTATIDSLLSDVSSNWINWNKITGIEPVEINYLPEVREHFLSGKMVNGKGQGDYALLSIPGKQAFFQYATTDSKGSFSFGIPIDEQLRELIIQPDDMKGIVNLSSSFSEDYASHGHITDTLPVPGYVSDWSVNFQVQKIYGTVFSENLPPQLASEKFRRFYGKPDVQLVLSDYIELPLMEEIFFELLPGTYLKKRKSQYEIYVTDPVTNMVYDYPTTLFVDGVRVDDADAIAALDPLLVEQIDVVRERYLIGNYLFHGLVNIITRAGDFTAVPIPDYAVRTYYRVIDPIQKFISPDYMRPEQKNSRIPDFRNTLWWNPSVVKDEPLEFWSSDVPGVYKITLNGVGADGSPVSAEKIIRIE